jgi:hypothetical protein
MGKIKQLKAYLRGIFTKGSLLTHLKNAITVITNKGKLIYQMYNKELSIFFLIEAYNDPAFKWRGFSIFVKVTELISYLKIKNCGAGTGVWHETHVSRCDYHVEC